jgi:hypothetical protein
MESDVAGLVSDLSSYLKLDAAELGMSGRSGHGQSKSLLQSLVHWPYSILVVQFRPYNGTLVLDGDGLANVRHRSSGSGNRELGISAEPYHGRQMPTQLSRD